MMNIIQWFIRLIRKDMQAFSEETEEDTELYAHVKERLEDEKKQDEEEQKYELYRSGQPGKGRR